MTKGWRILNNRPVLFVTLAMIAGILLSVCFFRNTIAFFSILSAAAVITLIFVFPCKKRKIILLFLGFAAGYLGFYIQNAVTARDFSGEYTVTGKVYSYYEYDGGYVIRLKNVEADGKKLNGNARFYYNGEEPYECFTVLTLKTKIKNNPLSGSKDFSAYGSGICYDLYDTEFIAMDTDYSFFDAIRVRATGNAKLYVGSSAAGIFNSLLFGDLTGVDASDSDAVRNAGLSHILAVSGLHINFLIMIVTVLLSRLRIRRSIKTFLSLALIGLFIAICGFPPSAVRAGIMAAVYFIASTLHRRPDPLSALAFTLSCIYLSDPKSLFSLGLQMSALAVLGIICFFRPLYAKFKPKRALSKALASSVAMSLSANVFLLPLTASVFGTFQVYFIFANIIAVPLAAFCFTCLFLTALLNLIFPYFGKLYTLCAIPVRGFIATASFFSSLPYALISTAPLYPVLIGFALVMLLFSRFFLISKRKKFVSASAVSAVFLTLQIVVFFLL